MPAKNKNTRTAQLPRRSAQRGKSRKKPGQQRSDKAKSSVAKPLGSLFSVVLKPKGGAEIFFKQEGNFRYEGSVQDVYYNLLDCVHNFTKLLKVEGISFDVAPALGFGTATDHLLRTFEKYVPNGMEYNIEYDSVNGYHFVIYKDLGEQEQMSVFDIKSTVNDLSENYPKLHDIFISFLKAMITVWDVNFWFHQDYPLDFMEDNVYQGEMDPEDHKAYTECIADYNRGEAKEYENLIRKAKYIKPEAILSALNRLKITHPIIPVIRKGCELMKEPYGVEQFTYDPVYDENEGYGQGLRFYSQVIVTWDLGDIFFNEWEEMINCDAQEGVYPPCINISITPKTKKIPFDWMRDGYAWPLKIKNFFEFVNKK